MGDVDADPLPFEFCATATVVPQPQKGSSTTLPRCSLRGDAFEKFFGLLGWVTEALLREVVHRANVCPYVLKWHSR